ncbi:hypothetical protein AQZ52_14960 [Novosphingobium fuchskuhlense]|uniref:S-adenosyl-L-homocysteine hydrolase n=1 Tax=Novosphingobium fuchskuhlense TaxID=1117702 RepID=A0A117USQ3_9SPHN|nr:hypothetical protein [Novosphingobium fuchskuhlense]KUR70161.1 hypothetical protein AQZ52_14960 [Novosphingobium fuchskuhlense]
MKPFLPRTAAVFALGSLLFAAPAQAACIDSQTATAARIHQFETMMMVVSLRCSRIGYDMRGTYETMVVAHQAPFGQAATRLRHYLGGDGIDPHSGGFDRYATILGNTYGGGATTLATCQTLDQVAGELAKVPDVRLLAQVAETLIARPKLDEMACAAEH